MKILFLIPEGSHGGSGKQLALIAAGLPRDQFDVRVVVVGRDGPLSTELRSSGLPVAVLGWTRLLDPQPVWRLRQRVRSFRPDVIAGWGLTALRIGSLVRDSARLVLHQLCPPRERDPWPPLGPFDRWLLRRSNRVVAGHAAEVRCYRRLGMPAERVCLIPPGVAPAEAPAVPREELLRRQALPATARVVVCAGPLQAHKGYRDGLWALDILTYLYDDLHLVVLGDGPDRARLQRFARDIQMLDRAHFLGRREGLADWLAAADVVWVPSRADGGVNVALEAMSAGRPVIAGKTPGLAEVVTDGETGYLFAPGDKVALARLTRRLLDDASLRRRLGEAGQQRAEERFAAAELARRWTEMVEGMIGPVAANLYSEQFKLCSGSPSPLGGEGLG
jgi:glycosyltransferase involved in cell wall biosynthesis